MFSYTTQLINKLSKQKIRWCGVFPVNLVVAQLDKKFSVHVIRTQIFTTVFTTPLENVPGQLSLVHTLTQCFSIIYFNIILQPAPRSTKRFFT
jgi:hypothetical protein